MAQLSITIDLADADVPRLLEAFRRQWGQPDLSIEAMLGGLKLLAVQQMSDVVYNQEVAQKQEEARATPRIAMT